MKPMHGIAGVGDAPNPTKRGYPGFANRGSQLGDHLHNDINHLSLHYAEPAENLRLLDLTFSM